MIVKRIVTDVIRIILLFFLFLLWVAVARGEGESEFTRAEFSGIRFKTRYQTVKIDTPVMVEMENKTRLLKITLKKPETAKFKFLLKITPGGFAAWQKAASEGAKDAHLANSQIVYFISGKKTVKIGEITINTEKFEWLEKYKPLIEKNSKNCKEGITPNGYTDMVCPPLLIEVKITRIERSILSPSLPQELVFPRLDYIDIFGEILSINRP